jgi:uncharacterized protein
MGMPLSNASSAPPQTRLEKNVIYVVAKAPRAGQSKTRLCPPLQPEQAATLAAAFLRDTISLACESGADVRLLCRDDSERDALVPFTQIPITSHGSARGDTNEAGASRLAPMTVHIQDGRGLGAALESAFVRGLVDGYRAVGVLGMDTPALEPAILRQSFECLTREGGADVGFGPSDDGGYYLLTARRIYPSLFRDMVWSTDQVGRETLERCAALGLGVYELPPTADVDDVFGLAALCRALEEAPPDVAPNTRLALGELKLSAMALEVMGASTAPGLIQ